MTTSVRSVGKLGAFEEKPVHFVQHTIGQSRRLKFRDAARSACAGRSVSEQLAFAVSGFGGCRSEMKDKNVSGIESDAPTRRK